MVRPVRRADAGGDAARGVHAHVKIRAKALAVLLHHAVDAELLEPFGSRRHANESAPKSRHEIDRCGGHGLRRHDQIAFVFAIGVIHHDDHFPAAHVRDNRFNVVENFFHPVKTA